jgi:hypothetical protein
MVGLEQVVCIAIIVIPAKAGIQLPYVRRSKLDPDFRRGDEVE